MHLLVLLEYLFPFDNDIFLGFLDLNNDFLLFLKHLRLQVLPFLFEFVGDILHCLHHLLIFCHLLLVGLHGSFTCQLHLNFAALLILEFLVLVTGLHIVLPILELAVISHVKL
jgi:hypothetical protein